MLRFVFLVLSGLSAASALRVGPVSSSPAVRMGAVPTKERTRERTQTKRPGVGQRSKGFGQQQKNPFEWAMDSDATRRDEDNFHILLLNSTFDKPRMTVAYAAGALCLVLAMNDADAVEHAAFANAQGFSCLGTWRRDECLKYGEQLNARDVSVRVVPGVRGRQDWQGAPANAPDPALRAGK